MTKDETVAVGGTVTLTCWVAETDNSSLQWSNTAQQTLYFGEKRGRREGTQSDIGNAVSGLYEKRQSRRLVTFDYIQTAIICLAKKYFALSK